MARVLLIDDDEDLLEVGSFVIESQLSVEVVTARSGNEAIEKLRTDRNFAAIVCDYKMPNGNGGDVWKFVQSQSIPIPYILCSTENPKDHPEFQTGELAGYVEKPDIAKPLLALLGRLCGERAKSAPEFIRISIGALCKLPELTTDVYLSLSGEKRVRVFRVGDSVTREDLEKFTKKGVKHLYLSGKELSKVGDWVEKCLDQALESKAMDDLTEALTRGTGAHQMINQLIQAGLSPKTQTLVKKSVSLVLRNLRRTPEMRSLLDRLKSQPDAYLSSHSVVLAHSSALVAAALGWDSESTLQKLAMAAFMHDITLRGDAAARLHSLDQLTEEGVLSSMSTEEVEEFKSHPNEAAKLVTTIKDVQPDVGLIIEQHHELPDGRGFPQGLTHMRISPLSAVMIVGHEMIRDAESQPAGWDIGGFLERHRGAYQSGQFKKIWSALKQEPDR